jgi:protease I
VTKPREVLEVAGATTELVSPSHAEVQGWNHQEKAGKFPADVELSEADPNNYDALLLPGSVANPDTLLTYPKAVKLVRSFFDDQKPIAAICHGPWMLVEADVVRGRRRQGSALVLTLATEN